MGPPARGSTRSDRGALPALLPEDDVLVAHRVADLRDRGFVYQRLECWGPAHKDLKDYLDRDPEAPDVDEVRAALVELAGRCARLN